MIADHKGDVGFSPPCPLEDLAWANSKTFVHVEAMINPIRINKRTFDRGLRGGINMSVLRVSLYSRRDFAKS